MVPDILSYWLTRIKGVPADCLLKKIALKSECYAKCDLRDNLCLSFQRAIDHTPSEIKEGG